jgi:hypothetical protein
LRACHPFAGASRSDRESYLSGAARDRRVRARPSRHIDRLIPRPKTHDRVTYDLRNAAETKVGTPSYD